MATDEPRDENIGLNGDAARSDKLEGQGPDGNGAGTGNGDLQNTPNDSQDDSLGNNIVENSDDSLEGKPAENLDEDPDHDEILEEELDLDDLDLGELDFEDDETDDAAGGSSKKKIILIGSGTALTVALVAVGAFFFISDDGKPESEDKAQKTQTTNTMMIPPKRRAKSGWKRSRKSPPKETSKSSKKPALQVPNSSSERYQSPPKLSPVKKAEINTRTGQSLRPPENAKLVLPSTSTSKSSKNVNTPLPKNKVVGARIIPGAGLTVPATTASAFRGIPLQPKVKPLPAPRKDMMETVDGRLLPKISSKKETSWQAYAHPFTADPVKVRVSVVIRGVGLSRSATLAAIGQLPAEVSLAFSPYTKDLEQWTGTARSAGHETLLSLPMEPMEFPASDPGPLALMSDLGTKANIARLRQIMGRSKSFIGFVQNMGSRFVTSKAALQPILTQLKKRGLMFVDDGQVKGGLGSSLANTLRLPNARADLIIDEDANGQQIAENLRKLEVIARKKKFSVGIAEAYPTTVAQISRWAKTLSKKNVQLAPISGVVSVPSSPPALKKTQKN